MRVDLDGVTLGYEDWGRGPPLLLLHAFPLDRRMWEPLARQIERTVRVVALDFRGLGESTGIGTIEGYADDAARLLDHLEIKRATVGGLSMGGYAALAFARRHPDRMAGLLLADTRSAADSTEGRAGRDLAIGRVVREGAAGFVEEFVPRLVAPGKRHALDLALAIAGLQSTDGVASALAALRDRPDATPGLAAIRVPTMVVVGALDALTPPSDSRKLQNAIAGADLFEIAGAGHLSAIEEPDAFAAAVTSLMERIGL
ncbi:MAG: alpha/beta fold hydrolase [Myxococcales bacterium]|nr:alpha/beta fold hydrolase [Myxococcales bacterium]